MRVFGWSEAVDALEFSSPIEALLQAFRAADTIAPSPASAHDSCAAGFVWHVTN